MRTRSIEPSVILAALVALMLASAPALAQKSIVTKVTGVMVGDGTITRTIIDVGPEPNGSVLDPQGLLRVQAVVVVAVANNDPAGTVGTKLKNAINAAGIPLHSSDFVHANQPHRIKQTRQKGQFTVTDVVFPAQPAGGTTLTEDAFTVEDAPAFSPVGLGFLFGALPALAFWQRRRRKSV